MRAVGAEEAAPVGSEQLDWNLRRDGPSGDELLPALKRGRGNARVEILNHALPKHEQRPDDAQRQQHVQRDAHEIGPEVADGRRFVAGDGRARPRRTRRCRRCGNEILIRQGHHLRKMAHGGFPAVGLPVRIRQELTAVFKPNAKKGRGSPADSTAAYPGKAAPECEQEPARETR